MNADSIPVRHNVDERRFEARLGDALAFLDYTRAGDESVFVHTFVPEAMRGRGVGAVLVRAAFDEARRRRWRVVPRCSYVAAFVQRHPEFADLVVRGDTA